MVGSIASMRAEPCMAEVRTGICQPSQERALTPIADSATASQPRRDLLAGGDHHVIFPRVVERRQFARPADELVRLAGHGRDDDGDLMAAVDLPLHQRGHVADAVEIGHRRAAEFHHYLGHLLWPRSLKRVLFARHT